MQEHEYLQMLIQSLTKKIEVLKKIDTYNQEQTQLLQQEKADLDEWQNLVEKKAKEIDEINFLDQGFENVYNRVRDVLLEHKQGFQSQIKELQKLITIITELSVNIQAQEERNKQLAQKQFAGYKKKSRQLKENRKVLDIYKNQMRKTSVVDAQFLDKKN